MIHYMLLLGYILVTCHKNNIVTLHGTFMLYRRNKTCLLGGLSWRIVSVSKILCTYTNQNWIQDFSFQIYYIITSPLAHPLASSTLNQFICKS